MFVLIVSAAQKISLAQGAVSRIYTHQSTEVPRKVVHGVEYQILLLPFILLGILQHFEHEIWANKILHPVEEIQTNPKPTPNSFSES